MSTKRRFYITTAIAYVNGDPHLGHALEFVQADVLARHRRLRGDDVRFLSGTDDNALKNVDAALAAGLPVAEFVAEKAQRFVDLAEPLQLSNDDFIRTSSDPRHAPAVVRIWQACAAAGDLYQRDYEGLYCTGCEAFVDGPCPEHAAPPERVSERNWFFRLSRHADALAALIEGGELRVEPETRRNEVLSFLRQGLEDVSVSRAATRARGFGIPVPGDQSQVVHVWFDALCNYVSALGYGNGGGEYARWWSGADERLHVIGKGVTRFHALLWPAVLRSAGEPLPTAIWVHDYVLFGGGKLSKSAGAAADPAALAERYGPDAVRWWLLRDVPRGADAQYSEELLAARGAELADGLGNLVSRTVALAARVRPDGVPEVARGEDTAALLAAADGLGAAIDAALDRFDHRAASEALQRLVDEANRFVSQTRPWELSGARQDDVLGALLLVCRRLAVELRALLPDAAARIEAALDAGDPALARTLFPKVV
jgi:methionyl-tRNA synthetase